MCDSKCSTTGCQEHPTANSGGNIDPTGGSSATNHPPNKCCTAVFQKPSKCPSISEVGTWLLLASKGTAKGVDGLPGKMGASGMAGTAGAPEDVSGAESEALGECGRPGLPGGERLAGDTGLPGPKGVDGRSGLLGIESERGHPGCSGVPGLWGPPGPGGLFGIGGKPGSLGSAGLPGAPGLPGAKGMTGHGSA